VNAYYPECVALDLNWTCNLRCVQCAIFEARNPPEELHLEERRAVIHQVADWNPSIRLILCGGEPFTRRDQLFDLAGVARGRGLDLSITTNGTLLTAEKVERLPASGINHVVVSLDSDLEDLHDRIRGVPGTWRKAVAAIERLVAVREASRHPGTFTVGMMSILGRHNLDRVDDLVGLARRLGVDQLLFQPLKPVLGRAAEPGWWRTNELFPVDQAQVDRGIGRLLVLQAGGAPIAQPAAQLEDYRRYFGSPDRLLDKRCSAGERILWVDLLGAMRLCFYMERTGLEPIGNVRERSLSEAWGDASRLGARETMRSCREGCGWLMASAEPDYQNRFIENGRP
jgi:MoaA/NifB/PqqE/SkfB family radical SAM enzyme